MHEDNRWPDSGSFKVERSTDHGYKPAVHPASLAIWLIWDQCLVASGSIGSVGGIGIYVPDFLHTDKVGTYDDGQFLGLVYADDLKSGSTRCLAGRTVTLPSGCSRSRSLARRLD